jgi:hypothetical protein
LLSLLGKEGESEFVLLRQHTRVKSFASDRRILLLYDKAMSAKFIKYKGTNEIDVIFESDLQSVPSIAASQRQMYQRNMSSSL